MSAKITVGSVRLFRYVSSCTLPLFDKATALRHCNVLYRLAATPNGFWSRSKNFPAIVSHRINLYEFTMFPFLMSPFSNCSYRSVSSFPQLFFHWAIYEMSPFCRCFRWVLAKNHASRRSSGAHRGKYSRVSFTRITLSQLSFLPPLGLLTPTPSPLCRKLCLEF